MGLPEKDQIPRNKHYILLAPTFRVQGTSDESNRNDPLGLQLRDRILGNLEVNFIVMDALTIYNDIIGRLTLHNVKVVIAPHLLKV